MDCDTEPAWGLAVQISICPILLCLYFKRVTYLFLSEMQAMPPLVARANTRPQISNVVVSAASVDSPEGVAHLRFQRGSPLKVC